MQDITINLVGNLVADPQIRIVGSGAAVTSFRVGVTPRHRNSDTGQWQDGTAMFMSVSAWRHLAENVVASLHRGDRVFVTGRLRQRAYTTQAGEERVVWEVDADMVAADFNRHTATLAKPERRSTTAPSSEPKLTVTEPSEAAQAA
jgi:single-strand DNA-binding protein